MNYLKTDKGKSLLDKFLSNYRLSSFKVYQSEIKQFFDFYQKDIHELKEKDILNYRDALLKKVSASSLTRKISILSKFFSFIEDHTDNFKNPISDTYGSQTRYQTEYQLSDKFETDLRSWLNALQARKGTKETYKINVKTFFKWFKRTPREISTEIIQAYKKEISSKYEQSTVWLKFVALNFDQC